MKQYLLRGIGLSPDGLVLDYMDTTQDMRANGLQRSQSISVPAGADYDDQIEALEDLAVALLKDVLEDFQIMPPLDPEEEMRRQREGRREARDEDEPDFAEAHPEQEGQP